MLQVFKEKILKVKKPGNIQFLFLYLGSLKLENGKRLSKKMLKLLCRIVKNKGENQFLRKNACQYIGSFIAVASYTSDK